MPLVTPTPITALDGITPPSTASPADFDPRADQFLGSFPALQSQINTIATQTNTNASHAETKATEAQTSASNAATSETNAAASAVSASSAGNAAKWTAGTNFAEGACCWSPVDFQTYRKMTAGTSTTGEPTVTPGTWRVINNVNHVFNMTIGLI